MKNSFLLFSAFLASQALLPAQSFAFGRKPHNLPPQVIDAPPAPVASRPPVVSPPQTGGGEVSTVGDSLRKRYKLASASAKLVDNEGNGFDALYGTRNMRAVLNGVYYRGGANNVYNKHQKRSNMNPLPTEGLTHLCEEGFSHAVYLYTENFASAPKVIKCRTFDGNENTLQYIQVSPLDYKASDLAKLHGIMLDHVRNPRLGAIYAHCWNGWHSSGYLAATTLRQFCGFTGDQAVAYWDTNTDGNNGSSYNGIRTRIRAFVPNPDLSLNAAEKAALCPSPGSLAYVK
jgi:hypothetical protein